MKDKSPVNIVVPVYNVADLLSDASTHCSHRHTRTYESSWSTTGPQTTAPQYATDMQNKTRASPVSTGRMAGSQLPVTRESTMCSQSKNPRADDT